MVSGLMFIGGVAAFGAASLAIYFVLDKVIFKNT